MTKPQLAEGIEMAKRYTELYKVGLVGITPGIFHEPKLQVTVDEFKRHYSDGEFHFRPHSEEYYEVYVRDEGVTVFALLGKKDLLKGEEDE